MEEPLLLRATVTFFGENTDEFGLTVPFHRYYVVAERWNFTDAGGITSILSLSDKSPMPEQRHIIAKEGAEREALDKAVKQLKQLPANKDLMVVMSRDA